MVGFSDGSSIGTSGIFVLGCGSIDSEENFYYRVMVKLPNGSMKSVKLEDDVIITYGKTPMIKLKVKDVVRGEYFHEYNDSHYPELIIPEGSIKYENELNGK